MNEFDGNLITVEGLDGSGTTTLCDNLQDVLGGKYEFTQEPSHGKYGRIVREELQSESEPTLADLFLFMSDRWDHCESLIGPKLDEGTDVVCDRYNLSTYAYQSQVVSEDLQMNHPIQYIGQLVNRWVIEPDLTIFIDVPVGECLDRIDGGIEKYEDENRLYKADSIYRDFADTLTHIETVDGLQSEEEVLEDTLRLMNEL